MNKQYAQQAITVGLFIAMETFKSLPLAEFRQIYVVVCLTLICL